MTATVSRAPVDLSDRPASSLTGVGSLIRHGLRVDRTRILVWTLSIVGFTAVFVPALAELYADDAGRQARAEIITTPVGVVFGGPGYGVEDYTIGAMVANEFLMTFLILVTVMSVMLTLRHTRTEEETGRSELVRAAAVGRHAPAVAALASVALVNLLIGALTAAVLVGTGLDAGGSAAFGLGMTLTGVVFAAVAAACAQVLEHGRAAVGAALAVAGAFYLVRVAGDLQQVGGSTLSWFSPFSWPNQTRPYVDLRWWPLGLSLVVAVAFLVLAAALGARRDLGAGLVRARLGRTHAPSRLAGPFAMALRQQRGLILGWAIGTFVLGASFGSVGDQIAEMVGSNPSIELIVGDAQDVVAGFFAVVLALDSLLVASFAISSVASHRGEEADGRASLAMSWALSRARWLVGGLAATLLGIVVVILAGAVGMAASAAATSYDEPWALLWQQLVYLPAVLAIAGLAVLLLGWAPRLLGLAWVLVGYGFVTTYVGDLLELPEWAMNLSPVSVTPGVPAEDPAGVPLLVLTVLAAGLVVVGLLGFRRRDLTA